LPLNPDNLHPTSQPARERADESTIIAALSVEFHDTLNTTQIEMCVNRIETAIKQAQPDITILFVKPQSAKTWRRRIVQLSATSGHDADTD
jgi:divalent metal cation (Fe/Co/Zn/Cd) transporter